MQPPTRPDIRVPDKLGFGQVSTTSRRTRILTVRNEGTATLNCSIDKPEGPFYCEPGTCGSLEPSIAPGSSCNLKVVFSPEDDGLQSGVIVIRSNDPDTPTKQVALTGRGIGPW